jgi:hypothetical protein
MKFSIHKIKNTLQANMLILVYKVFLYLFLDCYTLSVKIFIKVLFRFPVKYVRNISI